MKTKFVAEGFDQVKPIGSTIWPIRSVDFGQFPLGLWEMIYFEEPINTTCLIFCFNSLLKTDSTII